MSAWRCSVCADRGEILLPDHGGLRPCSACGPQADRETPCGRAPILSPAEVANNRLRALLAVNARMVNAPPEVVEAMGHALDLLRAELDGEMALADGIAVRVRVLVFAESNGTYWCVGADAHESWSESTDQELAATAKPTALLTAVVRKPGPVMPAHVRAL